MKTIRLAVALLILTCCATHAESLEDEKLLEEVQSILKECHFQLPSDNHWDCNGHTRVAHGDVFTGSAVFVIDEPTPAPESYFDLASRICAGYQKIHGFEHGESGDRIILPDTSGPRTLEMYVRWTSDDIHSKSDEAITFRVQIASLRNSKIGIFLTLVHVTPRATPKA